MCIIKQHIVIDILIMNQYSNLKSQTLNKKG